MTIPQEDQVIQTKLGPKEWEFLRDLASRPDRFHYEIEAPIDRLDTRIARAMKASRSQGKAAAKLRFRIIELAKHFEKANGVVQVVIDAGPFPQVDLPILTAPTRWAVLDAGDGICREGWLNLGDAGDYKPMGKVPLGMKIICQSPAVRTYEDWVGMGAPPSVLEASLSARQIEMARIEGLMLADRPAAIVQPSPQPVPR